LPVVVALTFILGSDLFNLTCANLEVGEAIYVCFSALLKSYVAELVETARSLPDDELLAFFVKKWQDYCASNQLINALLAPLNRTWVKNQRSNGADVYEAHMLAEIVWKEAMFMRLRKRLTRAILSMVTLDRGGQQEINTGVIGDAIQCLIRLGLNKVNPRQPTLEVYKTCFETNFLQAIDVACASELVDANGDLCARMKVIEARLAHETLRLRQLRAHHTTEQRLAEIVVERHVDAMHAHTAHLLEEMQQADLARMYALLTRLGAVGLDPMRAAFESHVISFGRHAIAAAVLDEPGAVVATLVHLFRKYQMLVREAFLDDPGFGAAQDKAFRELVNNTNNIINNNAVAQAEQIVLRVPQLLGKYCDMIMRKGPKHIADEAEMERTLDDVALLKYVPDKDVFMLVYKMLLAKRSIGDSSGNADFEAAMISKLKAADGFEYTSSLW
jgi:cullin 1